MNLQWKTDSGPSRPALAGIASWHTLLVLGRVSNLPTVWSNVLAGWWIAGGGYGPGLLPLLFGATFLYLGGMSLNDACDREFDARYRRERPLPSGAITLPVLLFLSWGWLLCGTLLLLWLPVPFLLVLGLTASIILYDFLHKKTAFSPLLMAACRCLLCFVAGAAAVGEIGWINGLHGFAVAAYVIGLSCLARRESTPGPVGLWPYPLLVLPPFLFIIAREDFHLFWTLAAVSLFLFWMIHTLRPRKKRDMGTMVSRLLAGIVLVDLAALGGTDLFLSLTLLLFFFSALAMQRYIPAT